MASRAIAHCYEESQPRRSIRAPRPGRSPIHAGLPAARYRSAHSSRVPATIGGASRDYALVHIEVRHQLTEIMPGVDTCGRIPSPGFCVNACQSITIVWSAVLKVVGWWDVWRRPFHSA
ncbi:hypothetical protein FDG2_4608 [Candidatus Protofrankia californiensis]|uniref:Uncharacterized protein n=1 Tax=Candidatus Protofrankia californiensis TaxID=1839754 RepID=A0A1C3P6Z7_9ACTN|nr:hypothetical protein FDG2_4608 [Candidatus Protofrankia californiensis]